MRRPNRLFAIASAVVMIAAVVAACGPKATQEAPAQGDKPYAGTELDFWMIDDPQVVAIRSLLPQFEEETGIKVTITEYPLDTIFEKDMLALEGESGDPDLVGMDLWFVPAFAETDGLMDLTPFMEELRADTEYNFDDILPSHVTGYSYQGQQIAFGFIPVQMLMVYRADLFEDPAYQSEFKTKYGHDLGPAKTLDEFLEQVEFFTRDTDGDGETDLWGTATQMERDDPIYCAFSHFMYGYGGDIVDENTREVVFNSAENQRGLEDLVNMVNNYAPPGSVGFGWDEMMSAMQTGQVAVQLNWNVFMGEYENPEASVVAGKLGYAPVPEGAVRRSLLGGWGIGINANTESVDASKEFIRWLLRQDTDKAIALAGGAAPMRMSNYADPEVIARFPHGEASLETAKYSTPPPRVIEFPELMETMGLALSEAASGMKTPAEALSSGAARMEEIMSGG
jgi:multiple sugar transport system substrate-binding protein